MEALSQQKTDDADLMINPNMVQKPEFSQWLSNLPRTTPTDLFFNTIDASIQTVEEGTSASPIGRRHGGGGGRRGGSGGRRSRGGRPFSSRAIRRGRRAGRAARRATTRSLEELNELVGRGGRGVQRGARAFGRGFGRRLGRLGLPYLFGRGYGYRSCPPGYAWSPYFRRCIPIDPYYPVHGIIASRIGAPTCEESCPPDTQLIRTTFHASKPYPTFFAVPALTA